VTTPISVDRVVVHGGAQDVLSEVSLTINAAEVVAILGPSGSGKSTLLRVVLGLLAPDRGLVKLNGELVSADGRILRSV